MSELLANALPEVAKANDTAWSDDTPFETGTLYTATASGQEEQTKKRNQSGKGTSTEEMPIQRDLFENIESTTPSEELPSSTTIKNPLSEKPKKLPVRMESMRHDIEFRQSNRSADFIEGLEEEESTNRFINRGRLLHTLFSSIETAADIDMAIDRLVFEGIIGKPETEEEIVDTDSPTEAETEGESTEESTEEAGTLPETEEVIEKPAETEEIQTGVPSEDGGVEETEPGQEETSGETHGTVEDMTAEEGAGEM